MNAVIIFSKYPEPEISKTRLGKEIGFEKAAELHEKFLDMLFKEHCDRDYSLFISSPFPEDEEKFKNIIPLKFFLQKQGDLGEKLFFCFEEILKKHEKVIIIGSDLPTLSTETVQKTFKLLDETDVVLGPTYDGGYYLIGMKGTHDIFKNIEWSTETVLQEQIKYIEEKNLTYTLLKKEHDIDTKEDLKYFPEFSNLTQNNLKFPP